MTDSRIYSLFSLIRTDRVAEQVFRTLSRRRRMRLRDLTDSVVLDLAPQSSCEEQDKVRRHVREAVTSFEHASLIKSKQAPIDEWSVYYMTADGLRAARDLGNL